MGSIGYVMTCFMAFWLNPKYANFQESGFQD
jgi:hypothetical protein